MIEIPLYRKGIVVAHTLVDDEDAAQAQHRWRLMRGYAVRSVRTGETVQTFMLHREILGLRPGDLRQCDHKNRADKLDNRRSNLRIATSAQNRQNVGSYAGSSSRFRGVSWQGSRGKWRADAKIGGRRYFLGRYDREEDAGAAAAVFRAEHMPFSEEAAA